MRVEGEAVVIVGNGDEALAMARLLSPVERAALSSSPDAAEPAFAPNGSRQRRPNYVEAAYDASPI